MDMHRLMSLSLRVLMDSLMAFLIEPCWVCLCTSCLMRVVLGFLRRTSYRSAVALMFLSFLLLPLYTPTTLLKETLLLHALGIFALQMNVVVWCVAIYKYSMDTPNIFVFLLFLKEINVLSFTSHASAPFLVSVVSTFMAELLEPLLIDIEPIGLVVVITIVLAQNLELSSCLGS